MASITSGVNKFPDVYSEYGRRYEDYALNVKRLYAAYTDASAIYDRLNKLYAVGGASQSEAEAAFRQMEMAELDYDKYTNEFIMNIQEAIRQTQDDIKEYSDRIGQLQSDAESYRSKVINIAIIREKAQNDMLVQIEEELTQNVRETERIENELENLTLELDKAVVKASANGIVNLYAEISPGDLLQSGEEIATIIPETAEEFRIQMAVPNKDIAGIKEGQEIKYHFTALSYQDYGGLTGNVELIGTDSRVNDETGESYYFVEASVKNRELINRKGEIAQIKTGMTCEGLIIVKSKTILQWLFEKIDLYT
jgi:HlyD family secretion protein